MNALTSRMRDIKPYIRQRWKEFCSTRNFTLLQRAKYCLHSRGIDSRKTYESWTIKYRWTLTLIPKFHDIPVYYDLSAFHWSFMNERLRSCIMPWTTGSGGGAPGEMFHASIFDVIDVRFPKFIWNFLSNFWRHCLHICTIYWQNFTYNKAQRPVGRARDLYEKFDVFECILHREWAP